MSATKGFYNLTPDQVLNAVDAAGFSTTGTYLQLNSYENRVFDCFLEKESTPAELRGRLIAKFYRPLRWSKKAILEEHEFLHELAAQGIPAVEPLTQKNGSTLSENNGMLVALFPRALGAIPQELMPEHFRSIGRLLARLHNIGAQHPARHRPTMNTETYGWPALEVLAARAAPEVWERYEKAATEILEFLDDSLDESEFIRIHGDCHKGNLLMTNVAGMPNEFFLVDFDDFCNGPIAQDFWMLFSGDEDETAEERDEILAGYEELRDFDDSQLDLIPGLRGLRILHYAAWIARRWEDPSFPQLFPQFESYTYWAEETEALEKIAWSL